MPLLETRSLTKSYCDLGDPLDVLRGVDLIVNEGEAVGIYGASGSGKSSLLHILGGLDRPSSGLVLFEGEDIFSWNEDRLSSFRNTKLGFVFQFYHLLSELTAVQNVMIPLLISGIGLDEARYRAEEVLRSVGLSARLDHRPFSLSGGEQQRVAIARAIVMKPNLLLADEPTGNLDRVGGEEVWSIMKNLCVERDMAMVVVSHNMDLIRTLPRVYELVDGKLRFG